MEFGYGIWLWSLVMGLACWVGVLGWRIGLFPELSGLFSDLFPEFPGLFPGFPGLFPGFPGLFPGLGAGLFPEPAPRVGAPELAARSWYMKLTLSQPTVGLGPYPGAQNCGCGSAQCL